MSKVAAAVDVVGVVARNPVRSVYRRRKSAVRQLILRVEGLPAHRVVFHSHRVLVEAVAAEPSNVQGAKSSSLLKSPHRMSHDVLLLDF